MVVSEKSGLVVAGFLAGSLAMFWFGKLLHRDQPAARTLNDLRTPTVETILAATEAAAEKILREHNEHRKDSRPTH